MMPRPLLVVLQITGPGRTILVPVYLRRFQWTNARKKIKQKVKTDEPTYYTRIEDFASSQPRA